MAPRTDLLSLDPDGLAERLVGIAQEARELVAEGQIEDLADLLDQVRAAADRATGSALALLEVAEAFLRAIAQTNLGKPEIALRFFAAEVAPAVLSILGDGGALGAAAIDELGDGARALIAVGALRRRGADRYDLRPSLRVLARHLARPAPQRVWPRVFAARAIGRANADSKDMP